MRDAAGAALFLDMHLPSAPQLPPGSPGEASAAAAWGLLARALAAEAARLRDDAGVPCRTGLSFASRF